MREKVSQTSDLWSNVIRWVIVAAFALLPLTMSTLNYDTYDLPKAVLLYTLTLIAAVSFLAHSLQSGGIVIKRNPLNKPLLAYAVIMTIATLSSPIILVSIIGEYSRYENLPTIYGYVILFFLAGQFMDKKEWLNRLVSFSAISFGIISIYGILQYFGIDFLPQILRSSRGTGGSTLENPVLLGGYLSIMIPLFLNYLIDKKERLPYLPKWLISILIGLGFWAAVFTESRGAWLAIIVGVVAVLIMRRQQLLRAIGTTFSIVVVSTAIALIIMTVAGTGVLKETVFLLNNRISTIAQPSTGSEADRAEVWKSSVHMISVRPLEGYGPDQMYIWSAPFNTVKRAQMDVNITPDRAENIFLQTAINGGLISLLVFLWLIATLAAVGFKLRKINIPTNGFVIGALAALCGYIAQGLSGIDVIGVTAPVWVLGGAVASQSYNWSLKEISIPIKIKRHTEAITAAAALLASILFILCLKPLIADTYYLNGLVNKQYNLPDRAISDFNNAVSTFPYQSQYRQGLIITMVSQGGTLKDASLLERAITIADEGLRYNEKDYGLILAQASACRVYASAASEQSMIGQAEQCYGEAISLNPYSTSPRRGLLGLYMIQEKYDDVIEQAKAILQIDPNDVDVKFRLAQAYEKNGKIGRAKRFYHELLKQNPSRDDIRAALENLE